MNSKKLLLILATFLIIASFSLADRGYYANTLKLEDPSTIRKELIKKSDSYAPIVQSTGGDQKRGEEGVCYRLRTEWLSKYATEYVTQWSCNEKSTLSFLNGEGKVGQKLKLALGLDVSPYKTCYVEGYWEP